MTKKTQPTTGWSTWTVLVVVFGLSALAFAAGRLWPAAPVASRLDERLAENDGRAFAGDRAGPRNFPSTSTYLDADRRIEDQTAVSPERRSAAPGQDSLATWRLAELEPNGRLRRLRRIEILRTWAVTAPATAAQQALTLPVRERAEAMTAVFQGAAHDPEGAVRIAASACASDPDLAEEHGLNLITTLAEQGAFTALLNFATSGPPEHRSEWLNATFYQWAERTPQEALAALDRLSTADAKAAAFQGLALGWSQTHPSDLAGYAITLPPGESRSSALRPALDEWLQQNPQQALAWMQERDPGPDLDQGAAAIATMPSIMLQQPDAALGWAQSIVEPTLRASTLTMLVQNWKDHDPALARAMVSRATNLLPADLQVLRDSLNSPGP